MVLPLRNFFVLRRSVSQLCKRQPDAVLHHRTIKGEFHTSARRSSIATLLGHPAWTVVVPIALGGCLRLSLFRYADLHLSLRAQHLVRKLYWLLVPTVFGISAAGLYWWYQSNLDELQWARRKRFLVYGRKSFTRGSPIQCLPLTHHHRVQANRVLNRLVKSLAPEEQRAFNWRIVIVPGMKEYANMDGSIILGQLVFEACEIDCELAFIIAIHMGKLLDRKKEEYYSNRLFTTVSGGVLTTLGYVLLRWTTAVLLNAYVVGATGLLWVWRKYDNHLEEDHRALLLACQAGYDPNEIERFISSLSSRHVPDVHEFLPDRVFATPSHFTRAEKLHEIIQKMKTAPGKVADSKKAERDS